MSNHLSDELQEQYEDFRMLARRATKETLDQPDWELNTQCVNIVKAVEDQALLLEMTQMLRRRLREPNLRVVVLTMYLIDAIAHNCGHTLLLAFNDEQFMQQIGAVARKYYITPSQAASPHTVPDFEGRQEAVSVCLELLFNWAEFFRPRRAYYGNIVDMYEILDSEGISMSPSELPESSAVPRSRGESPAAAISLEEPHRQKQSRRSFNTHSDTTTSAATSTSQSRTHRVDSAPSTSASTQVLRHQAGADLAVTTKNHQSQSNGNGHHRGRSVDRAESSDYTHAQRSRQDDGIYSRSSASPLPSGSSRGRQRDNTGTAFTAHTSTATASVTHKAALAHDYERSQLQLTSKAGTIPLLPFSQIDPNRGSFDSLDKPLAPEVDRKVLDVTLSRYHSPKLDTWGMAENPESKSDASSSTCLSRPEKALIRQGQADAKEKIPLRDHMSPRGSNNKNMAKVIECKSLSRENSEENNFGVGAEYLEEPHDSAFVPPALRRQISPQKPEQRALHDFLQNCHGIHDPDMQDELLQQVEIEKRIQEGLSRKENRADRSDLPESRSLLPREAAGLNITLTSTDSGNALQRDLMNQMEIERSIQEQRQRNMQHSMHSMQHNMQINMQQGQHYANYVQQPYPAFPPMPGFYGADMAHMHDAHNQEYSQEYSHEMQLQMEIEQQRLEAEKPRKSRVRKSGSGEDSSDSSVGYDGKLIDFEDGNNKDFFKVGHTNTYIDTDTPRAKHRKNVSDASGVSSSGISSGVSGIIPGFLMDGAVSESHMFRQNRPEHMYGTPGVPLQQQGNDFFSLAQQQQLQQQYGYPQQQLPFSPKTPTSTHVNTSHTSHSRTNSSTSTNVLSSHTNTSNSREPTVLSPSDLEHQQIELQKLIFSEYEHKKRTHTSNSASNYVTSTTKSDVQGEVNEAKERLLRQQESLLASNTASSSTDLVHKSSHKHHHSHKKHDNTRAVDLLTRKSTAELSRYAENNTSAVVNTSTSAYYNSGSNGNAVVNNTTSQAQAPNTPVSLRGYRDRARRMTDSPVLDTTASISAANAKNREREKREQREREIEVEWEREQERAMELEKDRERALESDRLRKKASAEPKVRRSKEAEPLDGGEVVMKRDWLHQYENSPAPEIVVRGGSAVSDLTCSSISSGSETMLTKDKRKEQESTFFEPIHTTAPQSSTASATAAPVPEDPLLQSVAQLMREALDAQPPPPLPETLTAQNSPHSNAHTNIFSTATKAGTIDRAKALAAARLLIATLTGEAAQPEGDSSIAGSGQSKMLPQASPSSGHTDLTRQQSAQAFATEGHKESHTVTDTSFATETLGQANPAAHPVKADQYNASAATVAVTAPLAVVAVAVDDDAFNRPRRNSADRRPQLSVDTGADSFADHPAPLVNTPAANAADQAQRAPRKMESYEASPAKRSFAFPGQAQVDSPVPADQGTPPVSPMKRENGGRPPHARQRSGSSQFRMLQSEKVLQALEEVSQANERYVPEAALQTSDESQKGSRERGSGADSVISSPSSSPEKEFLQPPMRGMPPSRLAISTVAMQSGISVITEDSFESGRNERSRSRSRLPRGAVARSSSIAAEERAGRSDSRHHSSRIPRSASVDAPLHRNTPGSPKHAQRKSTEFSHGKPPTGDAPRGLSAGAGFESMDSMDSSPFVPTKQLPRDITAPLPAQVVTPVPEPQPQPMEQLLSRQSSIPEPQKSPKELLALRIDTASHPGSKIPSPSSRMSPSGFNASDNAAHRSPFELSAPVSYAREASWDSTRELSNINRECSREMSRETSEWPSPSPNALEDSTPLSASHKSSQPPSEERRRESRESRHHQEDVVIVQDDNRRSRRLEREEIPAGKGHHRSPSKSSQREERPVHHSSSHHGEHRSENRSSREHRTTEERVDSRSEYRTEERHSSKHHRTSSRSRSRRPNSPPDARRQSVDTEDRRRSSGKYEAVEHTSSKHLRSSSRGSEFTDSRSPKGDPRYEPAIILDERRNSRRLEPESPSGKHHRSSSRGSELTRNTEYTDSRSPKIDPRYEPAIVVDDRRSSRRLEPDAVSASKHYRSSSRGSEMTDTRSPKMDPRYEPAIVDDRRQSRRMEEPPVVTPHASTRPRERGGSFSTEATDPRTRPVDRPPMEPEYRRESSSGKHRTYDDRQDRYDERGRPDPYAPDRDRRVYSIPEDPSATRRGSHTSGQSSGHISRTMSLSQSRYIAEQEYRPRDPREPPRDPVRDPREPRDPRDPRRNDPYVPAVTPTHRSAAPLVPVRQPSERELRERQAQAMAQPPLDRDRQQLQDRRKQLARDNSETLIAGLHMSDEETSFLSRGGASTHYRDTRDPRDARDLSRGVSSKSHTAYADDQTINTASSSHYYAQQQRIKEQERELHEAQLRGHLAHDHRSKSYNNLNSPHHGAHMPPPAPHTMHRSASQGQVLRPGAPPAPKPTSKPGWWSCHMCTLENPPSYLACDACGMVRGPA